MPTNLSVCSHRNIRDCCGHYGVAVGDAQRKCFQYSGASGDRTGSFSFSPPISSCPRACLYGLCRTLPGCRGAVLLDRRARGSQRTTRAHMEKWYSTLTTTDQAAVHRARGRSSGRSKKNERLKPHQPAFACRPPDVKSSLLMRTQAVGALGSHAFTIWNRWPTGLAQQGAFYTPVTGVHLRRRAASNLHGTIRPCQCSGQRWSPELGRLPRPDSPTNSV